MKKAIANILSLMFILVMAGCNLPGKAAPEPDIVAPIATAVPEAGTAVPTAIPTTIPEPLPSGYMDLLQNKIASGEWTLEEGLVTMLRLFAGEIQISEAGLGQGVLVTEGTSILTLAGGYLQTGTDQAVKDEITRLVNLLVPTQEALDRYSIPEEQATVRDGRGPGLAAPARQDLVACDRLWVDGFPDERTPAFPCYLFGDLVLAGNSYRVYYPLAWRGDSSRDRYYEATLKAVQKSIAEFQNYGSVRPIFFVFTTLADERDTPDLTILASTETGFRPADELQKTEACPVIINPASMTLDIPHYEQTIAHEIFHCFQAWHLRDQLNRPGMDSWWWGEGTAEYFGNLVYPSVNAEQEDFKDSFIELSKVRPLTDMDYQNFVFFQFLGNRIGPDGVIAMLRTMPTTPGRDAQLAALAAVPGMEDTFEDFVRSVLDHTLMDSDGTMMALELDFNDEYLFTEQSEVRILYGNPFVFTRYAVSFESEKNFGVETLSEGVGRSAWRARGSIGGWEPFPTAAAGGCEDLPYIGYVITTTPAAVRTEIISTTEVTEAPCDECLIGRWDATNDSVLSYMQSVISTGGEDIPTVESVTGTMFMDFKANGTGSGGYENLIVHETNVGGNAGTEVFYTFEGFSDGPFAADGSELIGLNGSMNMVVTVKIVASGIDMGSTTFPVQPEDFPVGSAIPTGYTCDGDTLNIWPPAPDIIVEPITYIRTSP
ncbi:MAG: DUF6055 domain-containing protein [Anaerolineales bacterium]|nr:DUF6055 domain-containing protein [Anaerolineales bacterium]